MDGLFAVNRVIGHLTRLPLLTPAITCDKTLGPRSRTRFPSLLGFHSAFLTPPKYENIAFPNTPIASPYDSTPRLPEIYLFLLLFRGGFWALVGGSAFAFELALEVFGDAFSSSSSASCSSSSSTSSVCSSPSSSSTVVSLLG